MADLPSSLLSPNFWLTESVDFFEPYTEDLSTSQYSLSPTSPLPPELEFSSRKSSLSGAAAAGTSLNHGEKDSHNAYERNCRRRLNDLYSSLRSLLPHETTPQKRKLSIPSTVSRVLKYIPELQRRVEQLQKKKEEMLSKAPSIAGKISASPAISALCLSEKEIMVQICMASGSGGDGGAAAGQVSRVSLCRVLRGLEEEGLQLMNGSSISIDDGRIFHSLHLQARGSIKMDGRIFCERLMIVLKEESV